MSASQIVASHPGINVLDGLTRFFNIAGQLVAMGTESHSQKPVRDAGSFSHLYVYIPTNTATVTSTVTLRKSVADTALTLSIGSDQTGIFEDTTNSVAFADTDEADYEVTVPTEVGTNNLTISIIGSKFTPDTPTDTITFLSVGSSGYSVASQTLYMSPNGDNNGQATEADEKYRIRTTETASDFYTFVFTNARTTDTTFKTRKNGADGAAAHTYTSGQTGGKEDTVNSDSLVAGDDFNYAITTGTGTGTIVFQQAGCTMISTAGIFTLLCGAPGGYGQAFNTTSYFPSAGRLIPPTGAAEATTQILPRFDFTAKELGAYVSANTIATSDTTVTLRDNGADSAVTFSYTAGQTGLKNDSVNTTTITGGTDELNYKVVTPNTSGTFTVRWIGILGEIASASAIKTINSLAKASVKTVNGLAIASVKTWDGLA